MQIIVSYIFSAMVAWVPLKNHSFYETKEETEERYVKIATTITEAAFKTDKSIFDRDNEIQTALLMASIASYESHYNRAVYRCKKGSPGKISWGIFQVQGSKAATCHDKEVGANLALDIINKSFTECNYLPLLDRLSIYTDGHCHRNWARSKIRVIRARNYYIKNPPPELPTN